MNSQEFDNKKEYHRSRDYYKILGTTKDAGPEEIKKAYRKKAVETHPDKNGNTEQAKKNFQDVSEAYEVLSDKALKTKYDALRMPTFGTKASDPFLDDLFSQGGTKGGFYQAPKKETAGGFHATPGAERFVNDWPKTINVNLKKIFNDASNRIFSANEVEAHMMNYARNNFDNYEKMQFLSYEGYRFNPGWEQYFPSLCKNIADDAAAFNLNGNNKRGVWRMKADGALYMTAANYIYLREFEKALAHKFGAVSSAFDDAIDRMYEAALKQSRDYSHKFK